MNLNCPNKQHRNFCYTVSNRYSIPFIPDLEFMRKPQKLFLLENTTQFDTSYSKYICVNCSPRKRPVSEKDHTNPHFKCIKSCCPLPYHWNLCESCIKNQHFPIKLNDAKRKMEAEQFQKTFSKLPEDIQRVIFEYVPTAVFAFTQISGKLFLEKTLGNGSRKLERNLSNQPNSVLHNVYGALICVDFAEKLSKTTLKNRNKYTCEMMKLFYNELCDSHKTLIICDEDFWQLRINEGVRQLLKRNEILQHIQKLLCPNDIRKYLLSVPLSKKH